MFKIVSFKKSLLFSSVIVLASMIGVWDVQAMFNGDDDQEEPPLGARMASSSLNDQKSEDAPEKIYQLGEEYFEAKNYSMSLKCFKQAAKGNIPEAVFNIGVIYRDGLVGEPNPSKALKWFERAKESGYEDAKFCISQVQFEIANEYFESGNLDEAYNWFSESAENEFAPAILKMSFIAGKLWSEGKEEEANKWNIINKIINESEGSEEDPGESEEVTEETFIQCEKLAQTGDPESQYKLGLMYLNGKGCEVNFEKAFLLFSNAAGQGHADSQYSVGICSVNGMGCEKNPSTGRMWYEKAAAQNHKGAMNAIAIIQSQQTLFSGF